MEPKKNSLVSTTKTCSEKPSRGKHKAPLLTLHVMQCDFCTTILLGPECLLLSRPKRMTLLRSRIAVLTAPRSQTSLKERLTFRLWFMGVNSSSLTKSHMARLGVNSTNQLNGQDSV